jgi:hypothetical protein
MQQLKYLFNIDECPDFIRERIFKHDQSVIKTSNHSIGLRNVKIVT